MSNHVALKSGGSVAAIIPQTIEEVFRIATAISKSGLAPKGMSTPEQVTVAIMHGAELGLPPMQSVQRIAVVNGRPTLWGDAVPALLWSRGFKLREWMAEGCAFCEVTRPTGETIIRTFSEADARKAGLWGKPGPWSQYPDRMKQMRARGFATRDGAPDVLGGLYLHEELAHGDPKDITPEAAPLRRNASQTRKSGDMERFEADMRACATVEALTAELAEWVPTLQTMPESWEAQASEFVASLRAKIEATDLTPETTAPNPIADEQGVLDMIQERYNQCDSEADVAELTADVADLVLRLSMKNQLIASAILVVP